MEPRGEPAKDIQHISKILENFSDKWTTRLKKRIKRSKLKEDEQYSRTDLCEELSHKHDNYAGELVDMLVAVNVFEKVGKKETSSKPVPVYSFTSNWRTNLGEDLEDTDWWSTIRPVAKLVFEKGEGKELI